MHDGPFYIMILIVLAVSSYYLFFRKKARVHAVISNTPAKKIGDVKEGENVTIRGKVVYLGKTMLAPLSKRKCVYCHVTVKDSSSHRETFRNNIDIDVESAEDVVIFDGENYAVINVQKTVSSISKDEYFYSGFWNIASLELRAFLKAHGERETDYVGWSLDLIAKEGVVEEGESLSVAGKASWRKTYEFDFKIPGTKVLYISPLGERGVYMTDEIG